MATLITRFVVLLTAKVPELPTRSEEPQKKT